MKSSDKILIECVPNFSEGRDMDVVENIVDAFRSRPGVKVLDYSCDADHNRMVVTAKGSPAPLRKAVLDAVDRAVSLIDLNIHQGKHPRIGAVDVIPFVPLNGCTMDYVVNYSNAIGRTIGQMFGLPVFMYEKSATAAHRANLANVRKGGFEGLDEKLASPEWKPDYGPSQKHSTGGAVAVGARDFLIAYNINLATDSIETAKKIAGKIRERDGGLPSCKALGIELKEKGMTQVSINLTDYRRTNICQVFEAVNKEAQRCGVKVAGSEIIGLLPKEAMYAAFATYLGLSDFSEKNIIEYV